MPSLNYAIPLLPRRPVAGAGVLLVLFLAWVAGCAKPVASAVGQSKVAPKTPADFEPEVAAFEAKGLGPLGEEVILFTGSSSVRLWALDQAFPKLKTCNLGFGGSRLVDLNHFARRLILPCRPKRLVVYEGDNDLNEGFSVDAVIHQAELFAKTMAQKLPGTRIWWLAIKPSVARVSQMPAQKQANQRLRKLCEQSACQATFVDTFTPLLGPDGQPDPTLFLEDNLHLNEKGYARWKVVLEPLLK